MMEEKFDTEFRKKVKGINPEIPDVVRMRINDTLAALPDKRSFRRYSYLGAVAALFFVCFIGIRHMGSLGLKKSDSLNPAKDMAITASESNLEQDSNKESAMIAMDNKSEEPGGADTSADEGEANNSKDAKLKSGFTVQPTDPGYGSYGVTANEALLAGLVPDGSSAEDVGVRLMLKSANYDGKEIRVEFERSAAVNETTAARSAPQNGTTVNSNSGGLVKTAGIDVAKQYEVRIMVNDIPLKCSVNVIETRNGDNQYSATMIIIPESSLPENFSMVLNFDKIGEAAGQWLLKTEIKKQ